MPKKYKCIASTEDDTEFRLINKGNNNNCNKNENNSNKNTLVTLFPIIILMIISV